MTHAEQIKVDGSRLFFFKSQLSDKQKVAIVDWFNGLSKEHRDYVDILRSEKEDDALFFSQDNS